MLAQPIFFPCVLSSGSTWSMPSLLPEVGDIWPSGGTAYAVFTDTTGATLATIDGTITPTAVEFQGISHTLVDPIPAGANCEVFITDGGGNPYKIRYGRVVRREVSFPNAPGQVATFQPLAFTDTLQRTALGNNWVPLGIGSVQIYQNAGISLPDGAGAPLGILGSPGAMRWFTPFNTDSVSVNINLLNQGACQLYVAVCSDIVMSTSAGIVFDSSANQVGACVGTGPNSFTNEGSRVSHTVANGDNYTINYNNNTSTITLYAGTSTSPLVTWVDSSHLVPHGPGYRYMGFSWTSGILNNGLQVSSWSAQDSV
jgi:hypothetical protein